MDQLPSLLAYLSVSLLVPVFLARALVRADWRTVRNACIVWYGFLLLAFGALGSQEGFGWALIFAMFWSIPAVPIIALVMKVWHRLGEIGAGPVRPAEQRSFWWRFSPASIAPAQWAALAAVICSAYLFIEWQDRRDLAARAQTVRQLFGLPAGSRFASLDRLSKSSTTAPRVQATMRFTDSDFGTFSRMIEGGNLWERLPTFHDHPVQMRDQDSISWRELPVPTGAGNRRVRWREPSSRDVANIRTGRTVCVAFQRKRDGNSGGRSAGYIARNCADVEQGERVTAVAVAALDLETKTLHVLID
jgi:hypothetical protein